MTNSELDRVKKLWYEMYAGTKHAHYSGLVIRMVSDGYVVTTTGPIKRKMMNKLREMTIKGYLPIEPSWRG